MTLYYFWYWCLAVAQESEITRTVSEDERKELVFLKIVIILRIIDQVLHRPEMILGASGIDILHAYHRLYFQEMGIPWLLIADQIFLPIRAPACVLEPAWWTQGSSNSIICPKLDFSYSLYNTYPGGLLTYQTNLASGLALDF